MQTLEQRRVDKIAASILDKGLQAPILVRANGARFVLVEGLHRLEAAKALGEETIAARNYLQTVLASRLSRAGIAEVLGSTLLLTASVGVGWWLLAGPPQKTVQQSETPVTEQSSSNARDHTKPFVQEMRGAELAKALGVMSWASPPE